MTIRHKAAAGGSILNFRLRLFLLITFISSVGLGKNEPKKSQYDPNRVIKVTYTNALWNKDSLKLDSAAILMRDASSGRLVQIHLDETGPDTATFSGKYSLSWTSIDKVVPEIFSPPQELMDSKDGLEKITKMIDSKELKRKPYILRKDENGQQALEVYDTREQVEQALENYRQMARLAEAQERLKFDSQPSQLNVEDQKLAQEALMKKKLARDAVTREGERLRLEQVERQRLNVITEKLRALPAAEQAHRKDEAAKLAQQGMVEYRAGHNPQAVDLFKKSVDLYPINKEIYFQYGVALYKVDKNNESLIYLKLADDPKVNQVERKYYFALNYLKLKETESALKTLREIKAAKHPEISPSAAFYEGVIMFDDRQYDKARVAFQECMDTSNDARLDETAEAYIEQIAKIMAFEAERAKHFILTGALGIQYDSNVPLTSDVARRSQLASGSEAERYNASVGLEWRHIYEATHEFSTKYFLSTQYSLLGSQETPTLRESDASMATFYAPYRWKGLLFGKGNRLEVSPGFEEVMEAIEQDRTTPILNSYVLKISDTMVNKETWFTVYTLEVRRDNSLLAAAVGDSDSSASKYGLMVSNIFVVGKEKTKMINGDVGYAINNAEGSTYIYHRTDLNVGYRQPIPWQLTWNVGLNFFRLDYDQSVTASHIENDYTLLTGVSRQINSWLQAVTAVTYTKNQSNEEDKNYNKWTVMVNFVSSRTF